MLRHDIVKALRNQRHAAVNGTSTIGPAAGDDTLWVLRYGNDHRGATLFDARDNVVWLCAYARHRSGEPDDAFPRFEELRRTDRIRPTPSDREALRDDRTTRFAFVVGEEAQDLLAIARAQPGVEVRAIIGTTDPVGLVVHLVETLEETYVAVFANATDFAHLQLLLAAFYDRPLEDWRPEQQLPTRPLDLRRGEFCLSIVHG